MTTPKTLFYLLYFSNKFISDLLNQLTKIINELTNTLLTYNYLNMSVQATEAAKTIINITKNKYVREGPHLWVSILLYNKGCLSSRRIWEEFLKDQTSDKMLIRSQSYLKQKILYNMVL